jgi:hypothetical protein
MVSGWIRDRATGAWVLLVTSANMADVLAAVGEIARRDRLPRNRIRLSMDGRPPRPNNSIRLPRPGVRFLGASIAPVPRGKRGRHR